ncbi:MAG: radical SAM protein [Planctomycetes bacterium]|nr:radical SAM protein [Planctomycetota bacterium]
MRFLLVPGNNSLSHVARCLAIRERLVARAIADVPESGGSGPAEQGTLARVFEIEPEARSSSRRVPSPPDTWRGPRPADTFRRVLEQLPHACRVTLVGLGEPLLHPVVADPVSIAAGEGRRVALVTNATDLERPLAARLIDAGLASIAFSLDCPNQALADQLRSRAAWSRRRCSAPCPTRRCRSSPSW